MLGGVTAAEAKSSKSAKYDLVIVGAGCGGLVCAIHAAELGLKPLLLEKMPMPAGNAIYAAGFLLGLNTIFQIAKNVPADTAEAFYDDMMKVSQQKAVPALTHTVVDNCTRLLEWLHSYCGINFLTGNKLVWPQLYRSHLVTGELKPGGAQLVMTLLNKAKAMGVEVRTNTKVVALIADPKTGGDAGAKEKTNGLESEVRRCACNGRLLGQSGTRHAVHRFCRREDADSRLAHRRRRKHCAHGTLPAESCQRRPVPLRSDLRPDRRQPAQHCQQRRLRQSPRRSLYRRRSDLSAAVSRCREHAAG